MLGESPGQKEETATLTAGSLGQTPTALQEPQPAGTGAQEERASGVQVGRDGATGERKTPAGLGARGRRTVQPPLSQSS